MDNNQLEIEQLLGDNKMKIPTEAHKSPMSWKQSLFFFVSGFILITLFSIIFDRLLKALGYPETSIIYASFVNLLIYLFTFLSLSLFLIYFKALKHFLSTFYSLRPYLKGFFYGFVVIISSICVSLLMTLVFGESESNANQQAIEEIIRNFPLLNFVWIVLLGPVVEELIYRVGLFEGLLKINRWVAYIVSGLIFGFIHFSIPYDTFGNVDMLLLRAEFINIVGYVVSGLLFAYIYEKEGLATSAVAHITNNLVSFLVTVIMRSYGT